MALIQLVRAILAYIQHRSKAVKENRIVKAIMCCVQCFLKCLQTVVEVVTRNAYIFVRDGLLPHAVLWWWLLLLLSLLLMVVVVVVLGIADCYQGRGILRGRPACVQGMSVARPSRHHRHHRCHGSVTVIALQLILNHGVVLAIVNLLAEIIMFLGKVCVAVISAFFCFWILERTGRFQEGGSDELTSSWLSVLVRVCCPGGVHTALGRHRARAHCLPSWRFLSLSLLQITLIFAYAVAAGFFHVYDIAVDTMLICFIMVRPRCSIVWIRGRRHWSRCALRCVAGR